MSKKYNHTFEISRRRWDRGRQNDDDVCLFHNETKKMCCLGFYLRSVGSTIDNIRDEYKPSKLKLNGKKLPQKAEWLLQETYRKPVTIGYVEIPPETELVRINDDSELTEEEREKQIKKIFADYKINVVFKP